jgi:hypothetical protein
MSGQETPMDQRVFGPYYSTPPEDRDDTNRTEQRFTQPVQTDQDDQTVRTTRTSLRQRLLAGRRRKTRTIRP